MNTSINEQAHIESRIAAASDVPMPGHLHAKIMKRVFLAGYGKYLAFSASILALNLSVLGFNLYRAFSDQTVVKALEALKTGFALTPAYAASAIGTLYNVLPLESIVATFFTAALSAYIAIVFVKVYRNPHGVKLLKELA